MFVICSGAKSILDLDKTYEYLETLGIPRIGFHTDYMPGFWYYQTNKKVDYNFIKIDELINYLKIRENLKQEGSVLIFNPAPFNKSIEKKLIEKWIKKSVKKAKKNMIVGKDLTPYLIKEINLISNNQTINTNMQLIINNAFLAGKLAYNYNKVN
jgi:pseudouridine-5'-phosphate glycosidase